MTRQRQQPASDVFFPRPVVRLRPITAVRLHVRPSSHREELRDGAGKETSPFSAGIAERPPVPLGRRTSRTSAACDHFRRPAGTSAGGCDKQEVPTHEVGQ
ncbi:hypothetical protein Celaphus_00001116 [Cervus elaphus hippelaphus]|uniref:Uncharacterized protein n=1 Tax=Cervus elaphus hippelaphus TaxID=46360 RepID=A0A212D8S3_CEREH|nr:hypothetical protein Celaphus_00001116 [Cervus elaphus hippelaphus]